MIEQLLKDLKTDLPKYQQHFAQNMDLVQTAMGALPDDQRKDVARLQGKISEAIKNKDTKALLSLKDEVMKLNENLHG